MLLIDNLQQIILKLIHSGFTTRHLHSMLKYNTDLSFVNERDEFLNFINKSAFNFTHMLNMYKMYKYSDINEILEALSNKQIQLVFYNQHTYPHHLKQIFDYPLVLFCIGDISLLNHPKKLAIVGSRNATSYTEQICDSLICELVKSDITIVSGMAMGADYFAHLKTIECNGNTIGVAGFGLDFHHPKATQFLNERMRKEQLVISEYYPNKSVKKWYFPERNRIISGLAQGVLITEAEERSGSLITVDQAIDQNRNVYCCPGMMFHSLSKGTNRRIQEGAKLVLSARDIIEDFEEF
ncbi:DNA-processing protein DprA [Mammaliicoccus stepanovicii]|nr:DNA-processing protein DprA [Mammaliicoccus stepanovicii]